MINDTTIYLLNYEPITNNTPRHEQSRRRRQGPLDNTWQSLHRHRCRRPPLPSLSATAAMVTIMGLVVVWCHLPPPSSSSLSYDQ